MCLLNPGLANSQCNHTECKNYYSLNKSLCLHSVPQNLQKVLLTQQNTESSPNDGRTQSKPFSPNRTSAFSSKIILPTTIRTNGARSDASTDEETELSMNKKKVKQESNQAGNEANMLPLGALVQAQNNMSLNNMNQNFLVHQLANNNLLNNNKVIQNQQGVGNVLNQNPLLLSMLQNIQQQPTANNNVQNFQNLQNMQSIQNPAVFQNIQMGFNPIGLQNFSPQMMKKPETIMQPLNNLNEIKAASSESMEDIINDFQAKTLSFLYSQNKMLVDLNEKNELVQDTLACLINEITALKQIVNNPSQEKTSTVNSKAKSSSNSHQPIANGSESITTDDLLTFLYGDKSDFEYQIVLNYELPLPLYRERNFEFTVNIVDKNGNLVENSNKIPLTISIYTCENPPKYIDSNTAGNKIFKGFTEKDMLKGSASFEKIQIKEVTSHFRNGWIFLVVHPKIANTGSSNVYQGRDGVFVQPEKIKPLVLEKIIVKAKKTKERDDDIRMPSEK